MATQSTKFKGLVPPVGLEPTLPKEPDFESGASTSSARGAANLDGGMYHGITNPRNTAQRFTVPMVGGPNRGSGAYETMARDITEAKAKAEAYAEGVRDGSTNRKSPKQYNIDGSGGAPRIITLEDNLFRDRLMSIYYNIEEPSMPDAASVEFMFDTRGFFYIQVVAEDGTDNVTGEPMEWKGRKWLLSPNMTDREIVQTAFLALKVAAEHEMREGFKYKDVAILDPHYDVDKLVDFRNQPDSIKGRDAA